MGLAALSPARRAQGGGGGKLWDGALQSDSSNEEKEGNMKVYIIQEDGERVVKALPKRGSAQAECGRLNAQPPPHEPQGRYEVTEVEVEPYASARDQFLAAKARAREATRAVFLAGCHDLFDAHPKLRSFGWKQYTPFYKITGMGWNPGKLSASRGDPDINGLQGSWCPWDDDLDDWEEEGAPSLGAQLGRQVARFLNTFSEDDLLVLFGDCVWITVHRSGRVETEPYDSDC
jgi:hypothetical protein